MRESATDCPFTTDIRLIKMKERKVNLNMISVLPKILTKA